MRREAHRPAVLRPAERGAAAPLPPAVPLLAALGLALLCFCTLPAVHAQRSLERELARLSAETQAAEERVEGLQREMRGGPRQRYLRIKATRELLHHGAQYLRARDRRPVPER